MNLIFLETLTEEQNKVLRAQNVDLDDCDFFLFFPVEEGYWDEYQLPNAGIVKVWRPKTWTLDKFVDNYSNDGKWYEKINFEGAVWSLGVRHH